MTKSAEFAIITNAIAALGQDSYCGPVLREWMPRAESDVQSDMEPAAPMLPHTAAREAAQLLAEAKTQAATIVAAAKTDATAITSKAWADATAIRDRQREDLIRAMRAVERAIDFV